MLELEAIDSEHFFDTVEWSAGFSLHEILMGLPKALQNLDVDGRVREIGVALSNLSRTYPYSTNYRFSRKIVGYPTKFDNVRWTWKNMYDEPYIRRMHLKARNLVEGIDGLILFHLQRGDSLQLLNYLQSNLNTPAMHFCVAVADYFNCLKLGANNTQQIFTYEYNLENITTFSA